MRKLVMLSCLCGTWLYSSSFLVAANPSFSPPMQLAQVYAEQSVDNYLVSEKFDGVRAYWDGKQLWTRGGQLIKAPAWFTQHWPGEALDGELWSGYGEFNELSALVRTSQINEQKWHKVQFLVFDAPSKAGSFSERYLYFSRLLSDLNISHVSAILQRQVTDKAELELWLQQVIARGGEGLMLHHKAALHRDGRSDALMKYKPYLDAEAVVIGYQAGKGKYQGQVGALIVRDANGVEFKLGSGLSDAERLSPPALGSTVTYRFQGVTKYGKPRFARYLRVREAL
ncbi:DNA ligase [Pseudoalteromonas fenneropenaei]|uniref:DNA ligase n=1 Tax=Pseudoalteromonas fenneropenaei TaxID=1737459 RepID=A0ABV7CCI5_9GAMM